jgi:hypothetical protein
MRRTYETECTCAKPTIVLHKQRLICDACGSTKLDPADVKSWVCEQVRASVLESVLTGKGTLTKMLKGSRS